jgi:hypothetical protein
MERRNDNKMDMKGQIKGMIAGAVFSALCGCSPRVVTQELPVMVEHTTTQHHTAIVRDTLLMRDSIYHYVQGDTCIIERWHHVTNVNKMMVTDTIRDTVPQVVTVTRSEVHEVNVLRWWQRVLMWLGGALGIGIVTMVAWAMWRVRH